MHFLNWITLKKGHFWVFFMIFVPYFYRTGFFSAGKQINTSLVVTFAQFSSLTALMVKKNHVWFCRKISLFFTNLTHIFLCFWLFFPILCGIFMSIFPENWKLIGVKKPFYESWKWLRRKLGKIAAWISFTRKIFEFNHATFDRTI